ncbi:HAMP domain-containing protein [Symbiopectobacterium purcellii]|uniref:HAMP domain-containing protein n=1 Tax=Symbiopectobacterium purcellii TaxID=2871826 RepID=UPI003F87CF6E
MGRVRCTRQTDRSIAHQRKDETGILLNALNTMTANLQHLVGQLRDSAHSIASATAQIAAGNLDLSGRTEEHASSLEETAASISVLLNSEIRVFR